MTTQEIIHNTLLEVLNHMGIKPKTEVLPLEENHFDVRITGNELNFLIGFKGQSLEALQNLLGLMVFKKIGEPVSVSVDINGYRDERVERLLDLTKSFIDKVRFFEKDMEMPPMSAWERRQVHMFVTDYDDVETESTGEGRERRVVLKIKRKK